MDTITNKKQYPSEQYLNELITNMEFAARAPVEVVRAMAAELQKRREADSAEPVGWVMADDLRDNAIVSTPAYPCLDDAQERTIGSLIALYAAPPVPVTQADVAQAIENLKQKLVECNRYNYCADAVKGVEDACRAVIYSQVDNPPASGSQAAESNRGNEWTGNPDIDNAIIMLDRIDTAESYDDDRIEAVKAVLRRLAGNSPVTPDSWISCSERMPDSKTAVLVAREFDRKGDWRMKWATYIPGHPDANDGWIIPGASWKPSHWMPLPEPPQEAK